jgi:hypothetical protein
MRLKSAIPDFNDESDSARNRDQRQLALEYVAEAWNSAEDEGVQTLALAHASLFAALTTLVRAHGEEATAQLLGELPDRVASGEYTLDRQTH